VHPVGRVDTDQHGTDPGEAIEQLVKSTVASMQAPALDKPASPRKRPAGKASADAGLA